MSLRPIPSVFDWQRPLCRIVGTPAFGMSVTRREPLRGESS
jgi:hypothetical protein